MTERCVRPYCNLTHGVVEGLIALGFEISCNEQSQLGWPAGNFDDSYDVYLVQRHPELDLAGVFHQLERACCLSRTAFLDGMDSRFGLEWFWAASEAGYFKTANQPRFEVSTLPFSIHDRYVPTSRPAAQDVAFFACSLDSHPMRPAIYRALRESGLRCEFGPLHDASTSDWQPSCGLGNYHNDSYFRRLNECKVAVNAPGGSPDCYRYWEIAASYAVLVSQPIEQLIPDFPDPPTPNRHYIAYDSADQIVDAVTEALDRYDEIIDAQREFFLSYHRSRNRAEAVLTGLTHACEVTAKN